jgi:hypothetical protein
MSEGDMRDADHAALELRLDRIEKNGLVHLQRALDRVEVRQWWLMGLVAFASGSGLVTLTKAFL